MEKNRRGKVDATSEDKGSNKTKKQVQNIINSEQNFGQKSKKR